MINTTTDLQERSINTIRFLAADAVEKANSGHPGLPMGTAPIAYLLWTRHMRYNPANPKWANRDRFVLSGGHGSMLLYSMLYLTGYDLTMDDIKCFRQLGSRTPGHPEYGLTPGVEVTTGPLGQGFANGVGMAIVEAHLAAVFNRPGHEVINHRVYGIVTDGDLMEGVASEAASLAGHLMLGNLIYLYDDNHISIDGSTDITFTEDRGMRFEAYGWHVQHVDDGNDVESIDRAIELAKQDPRPSIIMVRTIIGYGLPTKAGTSKAHSDAPGAEELSGAKRALNWPDQPDFFVPDDVLQLYRQAKDKGARLETEWQEKINAYRAAYPEQASELERRLEGRLPENWESVIPQFPADQKGMATRSSFGKTLTALAKVLPELMGGSADLTPSNNTRFDGDVDFQPDTPEGRYLRFGVREHGMGSIINGMAAHGGVIPYGASFLVFSDYMRPAIRLSALSHYPAIWVFTHDSIGLGEDGPTHQPIEQIASLRAIPNLVVIRPADANETAQALRIAIQRRNGPTLLALTRQSLPTLDRSLMEDAACLERGAYVLADIGDGKPELVLMASGSEVSLIVDAGFKLAAEGVNVRLVSFPSWELFSQQDETYRSQVILPEVKARLAVEAGSPMGWERWVGDSGMIIGMTTFGASAPGPEVMAHFGFTAENVYQQAMGLLKTMR